MRFSLIALVLVALLSCTKNQPPTPSKVGGRRYIQVSTKRPQYFSFTDGETYIPIGINMINPSHPNTEHPDSAFAEIERWMKGLSDNGGNYVRVWLSESFWDVEEKAGVYSEEKAKRIDRFFDMARRHKLRVKVTLEHFRSITLAENNQPWATKFAYHKSQGGPLDSISQYLSTDAGRKLFLDKIDYYQKRYGADTLFFGWELWNEMNAVRGPEDSTFFAWNERMLKEVKKRFPRNLVMQSLGSFDTDKVRTVYQRMMRIPENEVAQVHRYLDLGAPLAVCQESMDVIGSSAVSELLSYQLNKPVLLAETGAVEPKHAGPSKYYPLDTAGILLHDILFAPFFSGAAGTGMSWHWESYVHKNNLWYHYGRFGEAIKGIDPVKEAFTPSILNINDMRVYVLAGNKSKLFWIRDKNSNWKTELDQKIPPRTITRLRFKQSDLNLAGVSELSCYDPWANRWTTIEAKDGSFELPDFHRSIVLRTGTH
jgi:hypothetical protein